MKRINFIKNIMMIPIVAIGGLGIKRKNHKDRLDPNIKIPVYKDKNCKHLDGYIVGVNKKTGKFERYNERNALIFVKTKGRKNV